jgi:hydroxyacylglutathione hydrolase
VMIQQVENNSYRVSGVLVTHNHVHHVRGLKTLVRIYDAQVFATSQKIMGVECRTVRDGESVSVGGLEVGVISVPGHSQDSVVFRVQSLLFTGDALHAGLIGRTMSSYNAASLAARLGERILALPDDTIILPGHGPPSTVGTERLYNIGLQPGYADRLRSRYDFFV